MPARPLFRWLPLFYWERITELNESESTSFSYCLWIVVIFIKMFKRSISPTLNRRTPNTAIFRFATSFTMKTWFDMKLYANFWLEKIPSFFPSQFSPFFTLSTAFNFSQWTHAILILPIPFKWLCERVNKCVYFVLAFIQSYPNFGLFPLHSLFFNASLEACYLTIVYIRGYLAFYKSARHWNLTYENKIFC